MEGNNLKEKIRKNVKEKIAISNIRKEFDMRTNKNKIIYMVSSACAILILGVGIFVGAGKWSDNFVPNHITEIGEVELNINRLKELAVTKLDVDVQIIEMTEVPEKFKFITNIKVPEEYQLETSYNVYIRSDRNIAKYDLLHDYVFSYRKDSNNNIKIAFSELEEPLRDYFIDGGEKVSRIEDTELIISQWEQMYIVTFEHNNLYFDIETTGITENELVTLLESIISK